ncbi:MAG: hypothetical protein FJ265_09675 [Planctomycetes bacterium]|nr:hypothetical protein [Planctomycetota bacterium]
MLRSLSWLAFAAVAVVSPAAAQVTAAYSGFGAGCPGTGTGLGAMHLHPVVANSAWGSGNAIPFGWTPNRFQQVFLGSELPYATRLAGLALRQPRTGPVAQGFVVDLEVKVGCTTRWGAALSTSFAANWDAGAPVLVLPRTQVAFPDQLSGHPQALAEMLVTIPWATTFAWLPQTGINLLVEIAVHGNSLGNQVHGYPLDNLGGTYGVWGMPATATTGQLRTAGPVMGLFDQTRTAVPSLHALDRPRIGDPFRVRVAQCPASAPVLLLLGLPEGTWNGNLLPLGLGGHGAPGCSLLLAPLDTRVLYADGAGAAVLHYGIPHTIHALNVQFRNQALPVDPLANPLGLSASNGGQGLIGDQ